MQKNTNTRIKRITELSEDFFGEGEVLSVGIKYNPEFNLWTSKIKFKNRDSISEVADNADDSIKKLKNRIKKIIKRYNIV